MRTVLQAAAFSLLLAASIASAQTLPLANANIYLFAGNGNGLFGSRGDGGPADGAYLMGPAGVAVDAAGNVYIADAVAEVIREVNGATGIIGTVAGNGTQGFAGDGGPATSAEFFDPYGVATDSQGNLYIADTGNNRIRKVDAATGIITTVAGNGTLIFGGDGGPATSAEISGPFEIAFDAQGNLYIADSGNNRIRRVDATTQIITTVAGYGGTFTGDNVPATSTELNSPLGVALDAQGNLYIADSENNRVRRVDATTQIITTVAGNGNAGYSGDGKAAIDAELFIPQGLALDAAGNLYIADRDNYSVRGVDAATGIVTTVAGNGTPGNTGNGGPAVDATLSEPVGLVMSSAGYLYIGDAANGQVRVLRPETLAATTTTLSAAPLNVPAGQTLTLTATVAAASGGTPAGTVTFLNGAIILGSAPLKAGGATLVLTPAIGTYPFTANYVGSLTDAPSASTPPIFVTVGANPTTTVLVAAPTTLAEGQTLTLTATVTALLSAPPVGTVAFYNGTVFLGSASLDASGTATFDTSDLPAGTDTIIAMYQGGGALGASASIPVSVDVSAVGAGTTLNVSASTLPWGQELTLTATVTAASGTAVRPGQVNFCDATAPHCTDMHLLGMAQLNSLGIAILRITPAIGPHSYKAVFLGTNTVPSSSSSAVPVSVTPPVLYPTTTAIAASGNPGDYSLTATVTGGHPVLPSGTITFIDTTNANYPLATAQLSELSATFSLSFFNSANVQTSIFPTSTGIPQSGVIPYPPTVIEPADLNGDGKTDMAVPGDWGTDDAVGGEVTTLLGNGDGTFLVLPPFVDPDDFGPVAWSAMGDFNADGNPDLAVSIVSAPNEEVILLGNGDVGFTVRQPNLVATGNGEFSTPYTVVTGDFNGDGNADLAVLEGVINGGSAARRYLFILLGNGDGTFNVLQPYQVPGDVNESIAGIAVGDFNGDGKADLALVDDGYNPTGNSAVVTILLGNGDGTFSPAANTLTAGPYPSAIVTGDFNGDGILDLAVVNTNGQAVPSAPGSVSVFLGNGDGTLTAAPSPGVGKLPSSIAIGDFNGDGKADLAVSNTGDGTVSVLLGKGDGTFAAPLTLAASGASSSVSYTGPVATADFNAAGLSDITVGNKDGVSILLPQQAGTIIASASSTGISPVGTGTHWIEAVYSGDSYYAGSTSQAIPLTAEPVPTTLSLSASPTAIIQGQNVLFTATVSPDLAQNHSATGTVTFGTQIPMTGLIMVLGTAPVGANGVATLNTTALPPGVDSITATYSGDTNFVESASPPVTVTVAALTTTTLSALPTSLTVGQTLTLTATVTATAGTPTGTVTFLNGAATLGTGTLNSGGVATLTLTPPQGVYSITASYAGNINFAPSASSPPITVNVAATTTTTLSAVPTTLTVGQTLTLTATVKASAGITPSGTVTFLNGTASLGTGALNSSGVATLVLTLPMGVYSVTASYAGTQLDLASVSSPPVAVTVNAIVTTTTLTANPTTLNVGQTLTLTATVAAASGAAPTGTVTFLNGAASLGTGTLNAAGVATLVLTPPLGVYSITASYGGTTDDAPSVSSPPITVNVDYPATTTVLTATPDPAPVENNVTFTATVSSSAGTPTGTVSFYDGTALLGTSTLETGVATYSTSALTVGSHNITAQYPGVVGFAPSTSSVVVEVITPPAFSISASPASFSVYTGESATYTVTLTPGTGFTLPVALTCSQLPANTTGTFTPATVNGGSGSSKLVVQTTAPSPATSASSRFRSYSVVALAGLLMVVIPRRWRRFRNRRLMPFAFFAILIAASSVSGCGGPFTLAGGTPVGAQTITVNGTVSYESQTFTHTATVTLNVESLF